jgi:hypothetical protein
MTDQDRFLRRFGLAAVLISLVGLSLSFWPREVGNQWGTIVRAEMVAQVNGPSTRVEMALSDGRVEQLEIDFAAGTAEAGDVLCVEVAESWIGHLALELVSNTGCSDAERPLPD